VSVEKVDDSAVPLLGGLDVSAMPDSSQLHQQRTRDLRVQRVCD
jgi:hypothetical protein